MAALIFAYKDFIFTSTWNYKVTVEIETPEGVKSGSSVWSMSNTMPSYIISWPHGGNHPKVSGEAIIVDLGKIGTLFALIDIEPHKSFFEAFPVKSPTTREGIRYHRSLAIGTTGNVINNIPPFNYFDDNQAIQAVTPESLNKAFGPGVHFKRMFIEITDEPVTRGEIDKELPEGFEDLKLRGRFKQVK